MDPEQPRSGGLVRSSPLVGGPLSELLEAVEDDEAEEGDQVAVALGDGGRGAAFGERRRSFSDLGEEVDEHVRDRDAAGDRQPPAPGNPAADAQPTGDKVNGGEDDRSCEGKCRLGTQRTAREH